MKIGIRIPAVRNVGDNKNFEGDRDQRRRKQNIMEDQRATDMIFVKKFVKSKTLIESIKMTMKNKISPEMCKLVGRLEVEIIGSE